MLGALGDLATETPNFCSAASPHHSGRNNAILERWGKGYAWCLGRLSYGNSEFLFSAASPQHSGRNNTILERWGKGYA